MAAFRNQAQLVKQTCSSSRQIPVKPTPPLYHNVLGRVAYLEKAVASPLGAFPNLRKRSAAEFEADGLLTTRRVITPRWLKDAIRADLRQRALNTYEFAHNHMQPLRAILTIGFAMLHMVRSGASHISEHSTFRRPLKRMRIAKDTRLDWISLADREAAWARTKNLIQLLEECSANVAHSPTESSFALETLTTTWLATGGDALVDVTARTPSELFIDAVKQTVEVANSIYSHAFLNRVEMQHPIPAGAINYKTSLADAAKLRSVRSFLQSRYLLPACRHLMSYDPYLRVPTAEIRSVATDIDAILAGAAMPSCTKLTTYYPISGYLSSIGQWVWSKVGSGIGGRRRLDLSTTAPAVCLQQQSAPSSSCVLASATSRPFRASLETNAVIDVAAFFSGFRTSPEHVASILKQRSKNIMQPKRLANARALKKVTAMNPPPPSTSKPRVRSAPVLVTTLSPPPSTEPSPLSPSLPSTSSPSPAAAKVSRPVSTTKSSSSRFIQEPELEISEALQLRLQLLDDESRAAEFEQRKIIERAIAEDKARKAAEEKRRAEEKAKKEAEEKRLAEEKAKKEAAAKRRQEEEALIKSGALRKARRHVVWPPSPQWRERVDAILDRPRSDEEVLATAPGRLRLKAKDFHTLLGPTSWLNDEIVNSSLAQIEDYVNRKAGITNVKTQTRKIAVFNSFFQERMTNNPAGTRSQLTRMGITKDNFLSIDIMLIPVCKQSHWTLIYIRPTQRTVAHLDSLPRFSTTPIFTPETLAWIEVILQEKWVADEWKTIVCPAPMQPNSWDCGVHTITNGICLALGVNPDKAYRSQDLDWQRIQIGAMLLNGGFKGEYDLEGF